MPGRDCGQAVFLLVAVIALSATFVMATAQLGARLLDHQRARSAADAAALAAVIEGPAAAADVALANGARLVSVDLDIEPGGDAVTPAVPVAVRVVVSVVVTVEVRGVVAVARATNAAG